MPVKRRLSKQRDVRLTHEAVELFRRGLAGEDVHTELHPALGLRPWQPSPLQIDPDDYLGSVVGELHPGLTWSQSKPFVAQLRRRLEEELAEA